MEWVKAFEPIMGLWIATLGCVAIFNLFAFAFRTRRCPSLNAASALVAACFLFWCASRLSSAFGAGLLMVAAGWFAFLAGGLSSEALRARSKTATKADALLDFGMLLVFGGMMTYMLSVSNPDSIVAMAGMAAFVMGTLFVGAANWFAMKRTVGRE